MPTIFDPHEDLPGWTVASRAPVGRSNADYVLARSIAKRLLGRLQANHGRIAVDVQNSVVILTGTVESQMMARQIIEIVWQTPGVADVCNRLTVRSHVNRTKPGNVGGNPDAHA